MVVCFDKSGKPIEHNNKHFSNALCVISMHNCGGYDNMNLKQNVTVRQGKKREFNWKDLVKLTKLNWNVNLSVFVVDVIAQV